LSGIGAETLPRVAQASKSARAHAGVGKLTIHCAPKRSMHMPKYGPHGALAIGIVTFPAVAGH
jgi:hypothetical protein